MADPIVPGDLITFPEGWTDVGAEAFGIYLGCVLQPDRRHRQHHDPIWKHTWFVDGVIFVRYGTQDLLTEDDTPVLSRIRSAHG